MSRDGTISSRWVRARKPHRCDIDREPCLRRIEPGTRYRRLYGAAEPGDPPYVLKACEPCFNYHRERAISYHVHGGGLYRCCLESLHEQVEADPTLCAPPSGTRLTCKHCKKETLEYRGGGWRWSGVA